MKAMLGMQKIDLAWIGRAARGDGATRAAKRRAKPARKRA
jgi:hypothetical protein